MAGLLQKAKSNSKSSPLNKHCSSDITEIESCPGLASFSTLRVSRIAQLRHSLSNKTSTFSLRSKRRSIVSTFPESPTPKTLSSPVQPPASTPLLQRSPFPPQTSSLPTTHEQATHRAADMSTLTPEATPAPEQAQPISSSGSAPPPVPFLRLKEIANEACEAALSTASAYEHTATEAWNSTIINIVLQSLIKETSAATTTPQYKFAVNSTIIEHTPASSKLEDGPTSAGRRGMHAAAGAFWNAEKDGMWSFKYDGAEDRGLDVVVGIIWISVV